MNVPDSQLEQTANENSLRHRLLEEIAGIPPQKRSMPAPEAEAMEEEEEQEYCHPFRDLNVTEFARQLEAFFTRRWPAGWGRQPKSTRAAGFEPAHPC